MVTVLQSQKPGFNFSFQSTGKLNTKSLNSKKYCGISWLLLTKGVKKKTTYRTESQVEMRY